MSKGLPIIQNFDALLTLFNEPDKIKGYLNEIKAYRDEIRVSLDIAKTVDQARQIANEAVAKRANAEQYDTQTRAAAKAVELQALALLEGTKTDAERLQTERSAMEASHRVIVDKLEQRDAAMNARELDLVKREKMLADGQGLLTKRTAELDAREERLRRLVERNKAELGA